MLTSELLVSNLPQAASPDHIAVACYFEWSPEDMLKSYADSKTREDLQLSFPGCEGKRPRSHPYS